MVKQLFQFRSYHKSHALSGKQVMKPTDPVPSCEGVVWEHHQHHYIRDHLNRRLGCVVSGVTVPWQTVKCKTIFLLTWQLPANGYCGSRVWSSGPVSSPGRGLTVCLVKILYFNLTELFSARLYKWVLADVMLEEHPSMD